MPTFGNRYTQEEWGVARDDILLNQQKDVIVVF
jgi:hypothetical protein